MFYTYIVASERNGTIYVGSTDNLVNRIREHREKTRQGFTAWHRVSRLVWYEAYETREAAFRRERRIKEWRRSWKLLVIEERNPTWRDLVEELTGPPLDVAAWFKSLDANVDSSGVAQTPEQRAIRSGSRHSPG
jgi:putative endonuclease